LDSAFSRTAFQQAEIGTLSVMRYSDNITYVFALSYNALTLWRNVIASISYRPEHVGAIIASYSYRSKLMDQHYHSY
jgi:hypothetical protein